LETGIIDGAEAANSNYYSKKFYEVAPYWAQIGWLHLVAPVIMSKVFYDRLPKDLQHIVNKTLAELIDYERELYTDISKNRLEQLKELGIIITYPDSEPFRKAAQDVYNEWADKVGGWELINKIQNLDYQR
jgi:TRAP-type C4-dicarboxylate transport system substrate-binding protein